MRVTVIFVGGKGMGIIVQWQRPGDDVLNQCLQNFGALPAASK